MTGLQVKLMKNCWKELNCSRKKSNKEKLNLQVCKFSLKRVCEEFFMSTKGRLKMTWSACDGNVQIDII